MTRSEERAFDGLVGEEMLPSDLLAGWVHGTLTTAELARAERALRDRPALRRAIESTCRTGMELEADGPHPRGAYRLTASIGLAAAAGLILLLSLRPTSTERAIAALRDHDFGTAALLVGEDPRSAATPLVHRTASSDPEGALLQPGPLCFDSRPRIRWHIPGRRNRTFQVRLFSSLGEELGRVQVQGSSTEWPAAFPRPEINDSYLIEVYRSGSATPLLSQAFSMASDVERRRLQLDLEQIDATDPESLNAYRRGLVRARHGDIVGAAADLERLLELLGESARERLSASLSDARLVRLLDTDSLPDSARDVPELVR